MDKIPPHAKEIEEAFLGALIIEGDKFDDIKTLIPTEAFYVSDHQKVYEVMREINQQGGKIDLLTICNKNILPATFISNLSAKVGTASHLKYHSAIIYDKWVARELIKIGSEMVASSYDADDILDVLQDSRNAMDKRIMHFLGINSTGISIIDAANKSLDDYYVREQNYAKGILSGIPSTFKVLNRMTGGFQKEQLIILAARTGMGKSSLAVSYMITAAMYQFKCAFFSLEMTSERLMDKVICSLANIDHSDYKKGKLNEHDKQKAEECLNIINNWNVTFNEDMLTNIEQIHATCRMIKDRKGLDVVFIDYLQLMRTKEKTGNRENEISTMSRKTKMMAVDLKVPVILLSQLNRSLEARSDKVPMLSDLRESGAIEQDADIVQFIYRESEYNENSPKDEGILVLAKHREGERGRIPFKYNESLTKFCDIDDTYDSLPANKPF